MRSRWSNRPDVLVTLGSHRPNAGIRRRALFSALFAYPFFCVMVGPPSPPPVICFALILASRSASPTVRSPRRVFCGVSVPNLRYTGGFPRRANSLHPGPADPCTPFVATWLLGQQTRTLARSPHICDYAGSAHGPRDLVLWARRLPDDILAETGALKTACTGASSTDRRICPFCPSGQARSYSGRLAADPPTVAY